jgi:hypothetical protein
VNRCEHPVLVGDRVPAAIVGRPGLHQPGEFGFEPGSFGWRNLKTRRVFQLEVLVDEFAKGVIHPLLTLPRWVDVQRLESRKFRAGDQEVQLAPAQMTVPDPQTIKLMPAQSGKSHGLELADDQILVGFGNQALKTQHTAHIPVLIPAIIDKLPRQLR